MIDPKYFTIYGQSFSLFTSILGLVIASALTSVGYHALAATGKPELLHWAYIVRCIYHAALYCIFLLFVIYIAEVTHLEPRGRLPYFIVSELLLATIVIVDIINTIRGTGLALNENDMAFGRHNLFIVGYMAYLAIIALLLTKVRRRLYRQVMLGFYSTIIISLILLLRQGLSGKTSFTVATFMFPVIGMFYVMHSNPYDVEIGAVDATALKDAVHDNCTKDKDFVYMSIYLREFDAEGRQLPKHLQAVVRRFTTEYFRGAMLFQDGGGHEILMFLKKRNPDYLDKIQMILNAFDEEYAKYQYDYKIVVGESIEALSRKNEYFEKAA